MPDTEYMYIRNFPPDNVDGEHSLVSGSCSLPQLWPVKYRPSTDINHNTQSLVFRRRKCIRCQRAHLFDWGCDAEAVITTYKYATAMMQLNTAKTKVFFGVLPAAISIRFQPHQPKSAPLPFCLFPPSGILMSTLTLMLPWWRMSRPLFGHVSLTPTDPQHAAFSVSTCLADTYQQQTLTLVVRCTAAPCWPVSPVISWANYSFINAAAHLIIYARRSEHIILLHNLHWLRADPIPTLRLDIPISPWFSAVIPGQQSFCIVDVTGRQCLCSSDVTMLVVPLMGRSTFGNRAFLWLPQEHGTICPYWRLVVNWKLSFLLKLLLT